MAWRFISSDYPAPLCYQVPLLVRALRELHQWKPHHLAEAAGISLREVALVETPGHNTGLGELERVANAIELEPAGFFAWAAKVPLPANRSLTVWPPLAPLELPRRKPWLVPTA